MDILTLNTYPARSSLFRDNGTGFVARMWRNLSQKTPTRGFRFKKETRWRDLPAIFFHCGAARISIAKGSRVAQPPAT